MKTLLVALLLLVVGTGTAFAECAWVLWVEYTDMKTHQVEGPALQASYKTADECAKAIDTEYREGRTSHPWFRSAPTAATIMRELGPNSTSMLTYTCLPDTVDPRGPKEK